MTTFMSTVSLVGDLACCLFGLSATVHIEFYKLAIQ